MVTDTKPKLESLRCVVARITFMNEENGYTVLRVTVKGYSEPVTAVGNMGIVNVGSVLTLKGNWVSDSKYGRQFAVSEYEETLPASVMGIEKYLGSGLIKGVGPKFAKRIVNIFGDKTLDVIEETPDKLIEVPGLGEKRVEMIIEAWQEQKEIKNIMLFLQDHGVSTAFAFRIYNEYGADSIKVVKENPYKLTEVWGIGFKTADTVAQKIGYAKDSIHRCRSGVLYALSNSSNDGHCFLPRKELARKAAEVLDADNVPDMQTKAEEAIDDLLLTRDLILEPPDSLYIQPLFFSETGTARRLKAILAIDASPINADKTIAAIESSDGIRFDDVQKEAIYMAAKSKVSILTGGPGTGKTTTVKAILEVFKASHKRILLTAPTGRAAKRLCEITGMEAKTIHRLLEAKPPNGYVRNEDNKIEGDVLIVDESSMIDILLMYNLLKAVPDEMIIIFVGDAQQLPPVGPGNALSDMIASGAIPTVRLTHIFRQAMESQIIMNAHRINNGQFPVLKNGSSTDFFFVEQNEGADIPSTIVNLCAKRLPTYYHVQPSSIQVLTPMQRGDTGAQKLNTLLQKALNTSGKALWRRGIEYKLGDKVMQIKNNYNKEVYNGDIGIVTVIDEDERTAGISFDNSEPIIYELSELDELVLAYATTVHKAQGSEYDIVVLPLTMQHYIMLQRNLLYTAITRAKKAVVLVGSKKAVKIAVENDKVTQRNTGLAARLQALDVRSPVDDKIIKK